MLLSGGENCYTPPRVRVTFWEVPAYVTPESGAEWPIPYLSRFPFRPTQALYGDLFFADRGKLLESALGGRFRLKSAVVEPGLELEGASGAQVVPELREERQRRIRRPVRGNPVTPADALDRRGRPAARRVAGPAAESSRAAAMRRRDQPRMRAPQIRSTTWSSCSLTSSRTRLRAATRPRQVLTFRLDITLDMIQERGDLVVVGRGRGGAFLSGVRADLRIEEAL